MYLKAKQLIWDSINNAYSFLNKADDWIESTPADTLRMWLGIFVAVSIIIICLAPWVMKKIERTAQERKENEK